MDRTYRVSYEASREKVPRTEAELEKRGRGGCDVLVLLTVTVKEDGEFDEMVIHSIDGRKRAVLSDNDLFVLWMAYARTMLKTCTELSPGARKFIETIRKASEAIVARKIV